MVRQVLDASMMTEEQLLKVVPADSVAMVKNVSRVDQACSLLRSRFEVRLAWFPCRPPARCRGRQGKLTGLPASPMIDSSNVLTVKLVRQANDYETG